MCDINILITVEEEFINKSRPIDVFINFRLIWLRKHDEGFSLSTTVAFLQMWDKQSRLDLSSTRDRNSLIMYILY